MKYIAYISVEMLPDNAIKLIYCAVPHSMSALRELSRIKADVLGINLTLEQCKMRTVQHGLAVDALQCMS